MNLPSPHFFDLKYVKALLLFLTLAVPITSNCQHPTSRVRGDFSVVSTALEAYAVDNSAYPLPEEDYKLPSLLTTPIAYISEHPIDTHKAAIPFRSVLRRWLTIVLYPLILSLVLAAIAFLGKGKKNEKIWTEFSLRFLFYFFVLFILMLIVVPSTHATGDYFNDYYYKKNPVWEGRDMSLRYLSDSTDYIIISVGPDLDYEGIEPEKLFSMVDPAEQKDYLVDYVYDPTNGTNSSGDIIRSMKTGTW